MFSDDTASVKLKIGSDLTKLLTHKCLENNNITKYNTKKSNISLTFLQKQEHDKPLSHFENVLEPGSNLISHNFLLKQWFPLVWELVGRRTSLEFHSVKTEGLSNMELCICIENIRNSCEDSSKTLQLSQRSPSRIERMYWFVFSKKESIASGRSL
ncbi:hypothetical protein FF38_09178 [Lucilia cuprina]|uniref:Uncharacterized protein n=1 Tax=Lucilia cuprina TaxID=7375 RepID=A0A0L0CBX8_LUCCU|nr:hypothetical protein FF38_09178 [Lucilia cuprina]